MSKDILKDKFVGEILEEAGLINKGQIQVALMEQKIYTHLKLGEIIVLHGWLEQQTADFFGDKIRQLVSDSHKKVIGEYLYQAGLLREEDIKAILEEQKKIGVKFGSLAVIRGCIKQETLDFFLQYFAPESKQKTALQYQCQTTLSSKRKPISNKTNTKPQNIPIKAKITNTDVITQEKTTVRNYGDLLEQELEEIPWID